MRAAIRSLCAGLILLFASTGSASAAIVTMTWTDVVGGVVLGSFPVSIGDPLVVTVMLDNGNATLNDQIWVPEDFVGITIDADDGSVLITGGLPAGGLSSSLNLGVFQTDATGTVIAAPEFWAVDSGDPSVTNNLGGIQGSWALDGVNNMAFEDVPNERSFGALGLSTVPTNWTAALLVPEPCLAALFLPLIGRIAFARRSRA